MSVIKEYLCFYILKIFLNKLKVIFVFLCFYVVILIY
jgi:hypothetical protein